MNPLVVIRQVADEGGARVYFQCPASAGAGSIQCGDYHGFLQNGALT